MAKWISLLIALGLIGVCLTLLKALRELPPNELRRRARAGHDRGLYRLQSYDKTAQFILVYVGAASYIWLVHELLPGWWQWLLATILLAAVMVFWKGPRQNGQLWRLANIKAEHLAKILNWLPLPVHEPKPLTAKIYEKSDLVELIEHQLASGENRISPAELKAAASGLNLTGKKVSGVMTPLNKAKLVPADDQIGPHLLNELHKFSTDCFIVVKEAKSSKPEVLGTLYLADAAALAGGGSVKSAMKAGVEFIDEDLSLIQALNEFLSRKVHVLAVRNGFEELVGVLSLQSALEVVLGSPRLSGKPQISVDGDKLTTDEKNTSQRAKV